MSCNIGLPLHLMIDFALVKSSLQIQHTFSQLAYDGKASPRIVCKVEYLRGSIGDLFVMEWPQPFTLLWFRLTRARMPCLRHKGISPKACGITGTTEHLRCPLHTEACKKNVQTHTWTLPNSYMKGSCPIHFCINPNNAAKVAASAARVCSVVRNGMVSLHIAEETVMS